MKKLLTALPVLLSLMVSCVMLSSAIAPHQAFGQDTGDSGGAQINFHLDNPLGSNTGDLNTFLANILDAIVLLLTPVVTIMLLYSGFMFVTARGNKETLGTAKSALLYTLIGAAIVLGAKGLALVLQNTVKNLASPS